MAKEDAKILVTCECGEQHEVFIGGLELETVDLCCPACGKIDRLTDDQIADIVAKFEQARQIAIDKFKGMLRD